jgi:hypothetical protein
MNPIKKIIIEETVNALREVKSHRETKSLRKDLHEAVNTSSVLKDSKKKAIANKLVRIAESRLFKHRTKLKESHGFEDETEMAKAQLSAIMEKANELYNMLNQEMQLEDWVQYKLSIAENYIDAVHGYMKYFIGEKDMENEMEPRVDAENEWDDVDEEEFDDSEFDDGEFDDEEYFDDFDDEDGMEYDEDDFDDQEEDDFYSQQSFDIV